MSLLSDAFATTKKIFLVGEQLDRLTEDTKRLSHTLSDHEGRLIRVEALIEFARGSSPRLPGL